MQGFNEFLELCGGLTISQVVKIVLAIIFMFFIYKQISIMLFYHIYSSKGRLH